MPQGKIVEEGTHDTQPEQSGRYSIAPWLSHWLPGRKSVATFLKLV